MVQLHHNLHRFEDANGRLALVGMPIGDVRQLPGVFTLDTRGRIVFGHRARDAADHSDAETILAALAAI